MTYYLTISHNNLPLAKREILKLNSVPNDDIMRVRVRRAVREYGVGNGLGLAVVDEEGRLHLTASVTERNARRAVTITTYEDLT